MARWLRRVVVALVGGTALGGFVMVLARYVPTSARGLDKPATEPWHVALILGALATFAVAGLIFFASIRGMSELTTSRDDDPEDSST